MVPISLPRDTIARATATPKPKPARDEELENLIKNHSMIFMGMFEEAFSDIAEKMAAASAASTMVGVVSKGLSGSTLKGARPNKNLAGLSPELRSQIGDVFSGIREEMDSQWPKNPKLFKKYISAPAFDRGIKIVQSYDFGRPKLTEKLSDDVLASYVFLLKSGDKRLGEMFKELSAWQSSLPRPPWAD